MNRHDKYKLKIGTMAKLFDYNYTPLVIVVGEGVDDHGFLYWAIYSCYSGEIERIYKHFDYKPEIYYEQ